MQQPKKPYDLFYCYADEDKALLNKLETHLSALKREGLIRSWSKQGISPGTNWQYELNNQINRASIILLLVSSNFTHSEHVYNFEIERVVKKRQTKKAIIIPVLIRSCDWEEVKFGEHEKLSDYEVLPQNRKPVTRWPDSRRSIRRDSTGSETSSYQSSGICRRTKNGHSKPSAQIYLSWIKYSHASTHLTT